MSLFLLYEQRFPRYWPIFKIFIFGHEFQKLHIYSLNFTLLFVLYRQWFLRYGLTFKIAIFGH